MFPGELVNFAMGGLVVVIAWAKPEVSKVERWILTFLVAAVLAPALMR